MLTHYECDTCFFLFFLNIYFFYSIFFLNDRFEEIFHIIVILQRCPLILGYRKAFDMLLKAFITFYF